jgi:hypothetical protein
MSEWAIGIVAFVAVVLLCGRLGSITIRFKDNQRPLPQEQESEQRKQLQP